MNIAFVPVRCGSKSIPFKNIMNLNGKPLIYWCLESIEMSNSIDVVYVATDCQEIEDVVNTFSFKKVRIYRRDNVNARDESSTESVMLEFLNKFSFDENDSFVLVQATSPLTSSIHFDEAFKRYEKEDFDSIVTCVRTKRFFWNENGTTLNYDFLNRPRRQDFDGVLMENGAFYINSVRNVKQHKNRLFGNIGVYEMPEYTAVEIDEKDDVLVIENLMKRYRSVSTKKYNIRLFLSDVDGTLTDAGMYYSENGDELKKFNTRDGKGFELLRKSGLKTGIITSEKTKIVERRAKKLKVDFLYQGLEHKGKLDIVNKICSTENIKLHEVAYIGDDINCLNLLEEVGLAACPSNAVEEVKNISGIRVLNAKGGEGAVREFAEIILANQ